MRKAASRAQVAQAEQIYARFRNKTHGRLRIRFGEVRSPSVQDLNPLWYLSLYVRLMLLGVGVAALAAALIVLARAQPASPWPWYLAGTASLFVLYSCHWLGRDLSTRLDQSIGIFREIASGNYEHGDIDIRRDDEVGKVLLGLKSMQVQLCYLVNSERHRADEATRIRQALDVAATNIMVANTQLDIVYVNQALQQMMLAAEPGIRSALPGFDAAHLMGKNIDVFHKNPSHQRDLLAKLVTPHTATLEIDNHVFALIITPVFGGPGGKQRIGFVVEWKDRTGEIAIEREISTVVRAAADGDFSNRISLDGKQGFVRVLSENVDHLLESADLAFSELQAVLAALAKGDLTRTIEIEFNGRFADMANNANRTVAQLGQIIGDIKLAADTISTASAEIAAGNADLSTRTEMQAASVEETASSMEELTSTVQQNAANSQQARQLASGAAVEAARAGEQGRGFAVVASEVRLLAQRSASAAHEIKTLISDSVSRVESGGVQVEQAGKTIAEVVVAVRRVSDLIAEIAAASHEQSAGIVQVNQTITHIDEATQQNAALVEEATAAARTMEDQAQMLARSVAMFRV